MTDVLTEYKRRLSELTFNSQPIITELTQKAKSHLELADQIMDLITERIHNTIPEQKLFALYVLDDICKVVGNPYNILIGDEIYDIFIHVFQMNNDVIREKMVRLFNTWKVSTLRNTKILIFPKDQLNKIDQFLKKAGYPKKRAIDNTNSQLQQQQQQQQQQQKQQQQQQQFTVPVVGLPPKPGVSIQQSLINDIDQLIPVFERQISNGGHNDPKLPDRLKALNRLKILLGSKEMKPAELEAIKSHIVNIQIQTSQAQAQAQLQAQSQSQTPTPVPVTPATTPQPKINPAIRLFQELIFSGLVAKDQEPIPGSKPVYTLMFPEVKYSAKQSPLGENDNLEDILLQSSSIQRSEYEKLKFVELMSVMKKTSTFSTTTNTNNINNINNNNNNNNNISGTGDLQHFINSNKPTSNLTSLLYGAKPSKCSICGKRFTVDVDGTTKKRLHLDWHFRMNKKQSVKGGNIQSRNWFLDDYDWVQFDEDSLSEYASVNNSNGNNKNNNSNSDIGFNSNKSGISGPQSASNGAAGSFQSSTYVVVPPNDTNMNNRCLICREQVRAKYNDEIGEWVWNECIRQPGEKNGRRIVHVSCYNDRKRAADADLNANVKREKY
ncbi:hypothetical protein PVL30_005520 [Lodderomyces elongisporus]|uniref:uncharacterized protein n=1 Tax=Lodderomyces elongisporus TaxID=36914 RepID=UPI002923935E|nr:uncharacterized protein PVL30_005520 [Lodderomyces elongisporus]WLF81720.1 hypothetical protein PVL30_005520 [Lodderomyces elongisporus]